MTAVIDPLSLLIGIALYPVARMYWRLLIWGINSIRDHKSAKPVVQDNYPSVIRLPQGSVANCKVLEDEHGLKRLEPWKEGEYATKA